MSSSRSSRLAVAVAVLLLVAATASGQERQFPTRLTDWTEHDWQQMTPNERWFYLHGVYMGTLAVYNVLAEAERLHEPRDRRIQRLRVFGEFLDIEVTALLRTLEQQLHLYRGRPLWTIPYLMPGVVTQTNPQ